MEIHIGRKIREIFDQSGMTVSELARRIKTSRQNVYGIFRRSSIDTALLQRIGGALNYNFFHHYIEPETIMVGETAKISPKQSGSESKVMLQIELDPDQKEEVLKTIFGSKKYNVLKKSL